ncbi:RNA polymerase sigma factor [Rhizobium leucaenae]|jgi:RNA polymerase sigma-70 factor (ECF subfamily)|uniref:RNA polymerase sigma-70 factor (ECF subfamily) n=1 Tax=Rhizobium leucaenae TaxID=29450 RepID=A0A7W6ZVS2_9HYPH|nr:RNA polymerase sigma factor [Rhizobium leucaenae]MBB4569080.1 RNA polymerase sigma-70 factor (ECF subfamily) [Rhizobium leucaenae]MBB6299997.1 RNA polymerase sigma-70 factor (ECF subfamily) [Rhizobium leucaenae]
MSHGRNRTGEDAGGTSPASDSFEAEVLALLPSLRRYSRSLTRSDADGEDLLQDCVEKVLARRSQWRGLNLRGWVLTIMTNLYRNGLRQQGRRRFVDLDDSTDLPAAETDGDPLERSRLEAALNSLGEDYRAVLMLVVVEGYSYQDVATTLDIPIGTVMSRLSRARRKMNDLMNAENVITLRRPK